MLDYDKTIIIKLINKKTEDYIWYGTTNKSSYAFQLLIQRQKKRLNKGRLFNKKFTRKQIPDPIDNFFNKIGLENIKDITYNDIIHYPCKSREELVSKVYELNN
jgi:hypothetical protein